MRTFLVYGLSGLLLFSHSYGDGVAISKTRLQWMTGRWFERLGHYNDGPIEGIVYAPSSVIDYASHILDGDPSTWHVHHTLEWMAFSENIPQGTSEIVSIQDHKQNALIFLILPDRWIRLDSPDSLDAINYVLQDNIKPFRTLDQFPWPRYIHSVAYLYRSGSIRAVLSANFLQESDKLGTTKFLLGTEKDIGVLRSLCKDPVVVRNDHDSYVVCNLITTNGSIERWTVSFQFVASVDKSVKVTKINVERLYPEGSFSYGIVE